MNEQTKPLGRYASIGWAIVASGALVTASCSQEETTSDSAMDSRREAAMEMRKDALAKKGFEKVTMDGATAVTGEVPADILEKAYAELENASGGSRAEFELLRAEQAQWSDGSLGCPEPGNTYTDAPVSGYWVVLKYQGKEYDYRGNAGGFFRRCPGPSLPGRTGPRM